MGGAALTTIVRPCCVGISKAHHRTIDADATTLSEDACWAMLMSGSFGRISLSAQAMPVIVPVRYTVVRHSVHIQTPEGSALDNALAGNIVAFQADGFDNDAQRAWSVHLVGRVAGQGSSGVAIEPSLVEGRWLAFF